MKKNEAVPFGLGVFVGLILLSMYLGRVNWDVDASVIVAICALALAGWQGWLARKHNILSVQPKLSVHSKTSAKKIGYTITNKGLGTAYIKKVEFFSHGKLIDDKIYHLRLKKLFLKHGIKPENCTMTRLFDEMEIAKDESMDLFNVSIDKKINSSLVFYEYAVEFKIKISYQCIYGEKKEKSL
jgi:hypothetical protein